MKDIDYSKYYWRNDFIQLRQPKIDDWEELIHNMYDSMARFFFNEEVDMPTDIEAYKRRYIDRLEPGKLNYISFAIENNAGKHVGIANLFGVDERNGRFGPIGIQINPTDRNKGYGIAAYRMLARYMFDERRMHKWNSGYIEGNKDSEALHRKLGFITEGIQKDMYFHEGRYWNQVLCGITETQFYENEKLLPKL